MLFATHNQVLRADEFADELIRRAYQDWMRRKLRSRRHLGPVTWKYFKSPHFSGVRMRAQVRIPG